MRGNTEDAESFTVEVTESISPVLGISVRTRERKRMRGVD